MAHRLKTPVKTVGANKRRRMQLFWAHSVDADEQFGGLHATSKTGKTMRKPKIDMNRYIAARAWTARCVAAKLHQLAKTANALIVAALNCSR